MYNVCNMMIIQECFKRAFIKIFAGTGIQTHVLFLARLVSNLPFALLLTVYFSHQEHYASVTYHP